METSNSETERRLSRPDRRRTMSHGSPPETIAGEIWRSITRTSTRREHDREREDFDIRQESTENFTYSPEQWAMAEELQGVRLEAQGSGLKPRKLGVMWQNLSVKGISADATIHENVLSTFNIPQKIKEARQVDRLTTILDSSHGCVKPGEMLLVLGRPGAGCTTLLKMLANKRDGFAKISGDIHFGSLSHQEAAKYRGQIVMNTEQEIFFPTLTVGQTIDFATRMKVPAKLPGSAQSSGQYRRKFRDFLLHSMGIEHTHETKVGNEYVRGVSGGERKRVSIIEILATKGSVFCWDNSTRGLDASTALEWTKAIRTMTDVLGVSTIATLYQAGNGIYNLFDKVLVLDEGKQIYYGSREEARPFMERLGFICDDSANVADFLTGVTVPTERAIKPGYEYRFPRNGSQIRDCYLKSDIKSKMELEYGYFQSETAREDTKTFAQAISEEKGGRLPAHSPLTVSPPAQLYAAIIRQYQILWGDKATLILKQLLMLLIALVTGSLFFDAPNNSAGLFMKSGALFTSLLMIGLSAMSEVTDSYTGRPVLAKHRDFAFYHPAAFCIAQITSDLPVITLQISIWSVIVYFMVGLKSSAAEFFTFWIFLFATSMVMTALFRLCGAAFDTFDNASKVSGLLAMALVMYIGYMIPKTKMHPWFVWLYWINPLSYAFESLLSNEYKNQIIQCVYPNLVPSGPGYLDATYGACAGISGAPRGATSVTGEQYLESLTYSSSHIWRNLGILWAWWALFAGLTVFFTTRWNNTAKSGGTLLIPREMKTKVSLTATKDEESQVNDEKNGPGTDGSLTPPVNKESKLNLVRNTSVFTWKHVYYTVKTPSGDRVLLEDVKGWIKPGSLGCLMGSSGAGKTTLMDVLAQRKTEGTIRGSILVDGRPLPISFQRCAGYCEQLDVHEPFATVREALEFSALLRQPRDIPREEKLQYVDTVIDLLELHDLQHTLIGQPGAGLSVEQRKRVTIGVELVAKPSILIFLDEPTSGLDGQAAFNTLRFLKKLAAAGQAVLCTIHQPSAQLFSQFDTLLLLSQGGRTVYFGDIGENAETIKSYFARNGAPCPLESNPAEHMIDVVSGSLSKGKDWHRVWLDSPENEKVVQELDEINREAASGLRGTFDDGREFAADLLPQIKIVTQRMNVSLYRNTEYVMNKVALHIGSGLFNGFSFYMLGDSVNDLQLALFTMFNVLFVAPGVIAQLQPLFIGRRDIYDAREKKSKMYSWIAFVTGLIISEMPYLIICGVLHFVSFYYQTGISTAANKAGPIFFIILLYEFIYTGIGQFIAAYAPNATAATLINPLIITMMSSFCGVLVPYRQIQSFWRYWMYYLNPFTYLMSSLLTFSLWDKPVRCAESEFAIFDTPLNQTCAEYLAPWLQGPGRLMNLTNPDATSQCRVCQYRTGADYLATVNITKYSNGWRDVGICAIFAFSGYALVYGLMKLRTKASKTAQ